MNIVQIADILLLLISIILWIRRICL